MLDTILLVVWLLVLLMTIVNLRALPVIRADAPPHGPLVSVVIPARNEARSIEPAVRAMLAQTYRAIEVIVVNDRSTDETAAVLASVRDPRLTVISGTEPPPGWLGKPWALHQGSAAANGEMLLFVDADIIYAPPAVAGAVDMLRRRDAALASFLPHFEMRGFWENVLIPQMAVLAFMFLPVWLSNRTRLVRLAVGAGTGNLIRRDVYADIGGHEALKDSVIDDVALARLVRRHRGRTVVARADRLVAVRMYRGFREIVNGFTKNAFSSLDRSYLATAFTVVTGVLVNIVPYVSAAAGSAMAFGTVALITLSRLMLFLSLRYSVLAALFAHPLMVAVWLGITVRSMWRTGVRGDLTWRGRTYDAARTRFGADR